jgi:hypothetical protein
MASKRGGMTDDEIASLFDNAVSDADAHREIDRREGQERAIEYYEGRLPDIQPEEGRSSVVSHDVADAVNALLPSLVGVFLKGEHLGIYQPSAPEYPTDEEMKEYDATNAPMMGHNGGPSLDPMQAIAGMLGGGAPAAPQAAGGMPPMGGAPPLQPPQPGMPQGAPMAPGQGMPPGAPPQAPQAPQSPPEHPLIIQWRQECERREEFASQATDYVNHVLFNECDGYLKIRLGLHDGCLHGDGVVKHWWDDTPEFRVQSYKGLNDEEFNMLVGADDVDLLEQKAYPDPDAPPAMPEMGMTPGMPGAMPPMPVPQLHDVKIRRKIPQGRLRIANVPLEDFLMSSTAITLSEDGTAFCGDRRLVPRSDLIAEGYDRDQVMDLPSMATSSEGQAQKDARDTGFVNGQTDVSDISMEKIEVVEGYIRCDKDGDGKAEWRRVIRAGNGGKRHTLLDEEWGDDLPYSDIGRIFPVPHRWRGRSVFDETHDVQQVRSVILRNALDSFYWSNNPLRAADLSKIRNPDALQSPRYGEIIDIKGDPHAAVADIPTVFTGDKAFPYLEFMDNVAERRVGIGSNSMGLNPEALSNQTAKAVQAGQSAKETRVEDYARNAANDGMKRFMRCLLRLFVKHQDKPRVIRLRDKFVPMDPRQWSDAMDVTIDTGLGAGSQDRDISALSAVLGKQEMAMQFGGPLNPFVNAGHWLETCRDLARAAGLKDAESRFPVVSQEQIAQMRAQQAAQPQKPDPKMMAAQAKAQADAMKAQNSAKIEAAKAQAKAQLDAAKQQHDQQMAEWKAQQDHAQKTQDNAMALQLQQQMNDAKLAMLQREGDLKLQLKREEMMLEAQLTQQANQMDFAMGMHRQPDTNIVGPG